MSGPERLRWLHPTTARHLLVGNFDLLRKSCGFIEKWRSFSFEDDTVKFCLLLKSDFSKLIEQIKKHRVEMENWKEELESLLPRAGESATVDERILELDSKIERSIDGRSAISVPIKKGFAAEKINELISKIDQIIESE